MTRPASQNVPQRRRRRWRRWLSNALLLPPAFLYILIENVFWAGAKRLLRETSRLRVVNAMQDRLARLPPAAILPLFLIPEVFSHFGGFWATYLLVRRKWFFALLVGGLIKGGATLLTVWIYQACAPALLSIRWFAWTHGKVMRLRDWVAERLEPARRLLRRVVSGSRSGLARRFAALRAWLTLRLRLNAK